MEKIQTQVGEKEKLTPFLKIAALGNVLPAIKNRHKIGDSMDGTDAHGNTALIYAAGKGNVEAVRLLIDLGADLNVKNINGEVAYDLAKQGNHQKVMEMLLGEQTLPEHDHSPHGVEVDSLSLWEPEIEVQLPNTEKVVLDASKNINEMLSSHRPIDRDKTWVEVDVDLPTNSEIRKKRGLLDSHDKELILSAITQGLESGSISIQHLEEIAKNEHDEVDEYFLGNLISIFSNLECQIEDRVWDFYDVDTVDDEYARELFDQVLLAIEVFNDSERDVYKTINFLDKKSLLTHEDEIFLGKKIEEGYLNILKILSSSNDFLASLRRDFEKIQSNEIPASDVISDKDEVEVETSNGSSEVGEKLELNQIEPDVPSDRLERDEGHGSNLQQIDVFLRSFEDFHSSQATCYKFLVQLGINFKYIQKYCFVNGGQSLELDVLMDEVITCRNNLVVSNVRLANHVCRTYAYVVDLPYAELLQEGLIGLIKGAEKFDYKKGFRFTTYATWWIRQSVSRFIQDQGRHIRLPVHIGDLLARVERLDKAFEGLSVDLRNLKISELLKLPVVKIKKARNSKFLFYSIDARDELSIQDKFRYLSFDNEQVAEESELKKIIDGILSELPTREADVLRLRFGLDGCEAYTLEEVGDFYGVTRERIRQIESKVMKYFRKPSILKKLNGYFQDKSELKNESGS